MKSFFLTFLLLYLSAFPNVTPVPVVEIIEEELVVHTAETLLKIVIVPERIDTNEFPPHLSLTPQHQPNPAPRPPALS